MPQPPAKQFSGIFLCYRRDYSSGHAGRLSDRLVEHFGKDRIFMDIDTIEPGEDFVAVIENAVGSCEILIALIGRHWVSSADESSRRLDNPNDFIRLEIVAALDRDIRVIPVLVQGATMPKPQDLPDVLSKLARRQALELTDTRWHGDVAELISSLEKILVEREDARRTAREEADEIRRSRAEEEKHSAAVEWVSATIDRSASIARPDVSPLSFSTVTHPPESPSGETERSVRSRLTLVVAGAAVVVVIGLALWVWSVDRLKGVASPPVDHTEQQAQKEGQSTTTPKPANSPGNTTGSKPNPFGIQFVLIPSGTFMMGSPEGETDMKPSERKPHQVKINHFFYMGKYEVTQGQWQSVMKANPTGFVYCGDNCPIDNVSWNQVQSFIKKLNESGDDFTYRLPTEAEWEYACRAGTIVDYPPNLSGDDEKARARRELYLSERAWFSKNSVEKTQPVGLKRLNELGLADMLGNVWEWCEDWYHEGYDGAPTDGSAWLSGGEQKYRVLRGGSWNGSAGTVRSATRYWAYPHESGNNYGFRVVAEPRTR